MAWGGMEGYEHKTDFGNIADYFIKKSLNEKGEIEILLWENAEEFDEFNRIVEGELSDRL